MRVYLRAFESNDYILINKWRKDEEIAKFLCGNTIFVSKEREKRWVEEKMLNDKDNMYFAICLKEDDSLIGYESIINIDLRNRRAEWGGITIGEKKLFGKGIAKEAARLLLDYMFNELPIHKCKGVCLEEHIVTKKILASLGFIKDGILKDEVYKNGVFKTFEVYSLMREDYFAKQ